MGRDEKKLYREGGREGGGGGGGGLSTSTYTGQG